jgi:hypothetical protein
LGLKEFRERNFENRKIPSRLKPSLDLAIKSIKSLIPKLHQAELEIEEIDLKVFNCVIDAYDRNDNSATDKFVDELIQVRNNKKKITETIVNLENIVNKLSQAYADGDSFRIRYLRMSEILSTVNSFLPEQKKTIEEIGKVIDEIESELDENKILTCYIPHTILNPELKKPFKTSIPNIEPNECLSVFLGASAPQSAKKGTQFTARFVAYVKSLEQTVRELFEDLSPTSKSHLGVKKANWAVGTEITVEIRGEGLKILNQRQNFIWSGTYDIVDFDVEVANTAPMSTILKIDVLINEILVAILRLDILITESEPSKERVTAYTESAKTAFASYAHEDRLRVLDRIDEISRAGISVFLDCLSINPGEKWKDRIQREIRDRDLFLLFWSHYAKKSEYVTWEWKTALREKGKDAMEIHPLEPVMKAPPPEELIDLHFGTYFMIARNSFMSMNDNSAS